MSYVYKGKSPIEIAEEFIDSYVSKMTVDELIPNGISNYHHGVFLSGMENVYLQNEKKEYGQYIAEFLNKAIDENKRLKRIEGHFWCSLNSLDFRQVGNLFVRIYKESGDKRYFEPIAELVESLKYDYPKNSLGGLWHMKSEPNQMWLDSLYMAGPLCAKYGIISGKVEYCEMALKQAILMYENMHDPHNGLLYHGWDNTCEVEWADKKTGLSSEKWGRALGWFTVAVVDIIETIGTDFPGCDKLLNYLNKIFDALVKVQRPSGYWCQVIDKPNAEGNWEETSCTCLIAHSMVKAVRLGYIDEKYIKNAKRAYEAVIDSLRKGENGEILLEKICMGTSINEGTYEYYIARPTIANDLHGGGAFLLMCGEMNKCKE